MIHDPPYTPHKPVSMPRNPPPLYRDLGIGLYRYPETTYIET